MSIEYWQRQRLSLERGDRLQTVQLPLRRKKVTRSLSCEWRWTAKISERKTQLVLTSNYSTQVETGANSKARKKSRGSSWRCRTVTRKQGHPDLTFTTRVLCTPHLVTISLDLVERMYSKDETRPIILEEEIGASIFFRSTQFECPF